MFEMLVRNVLPPFEGRHLMSEALREKEKGLFGDSFISKLNFMESGPFGCQPHDKMDLRRRDRQGGREAGKDGGR